MSSIPQNFFAMFLLVIRYESELIFFKHFHQKKIKTRSDLFNY